MHCVRCWKSPFTISPTYFLVLLLHLRAVTEHLIRWAIIGRIIYLFIIWSTIHSLIAGYHHHNSHHSILINLLFSHLYVSISPRHININLQPWLFCHHSSPDFLIYFLFYLFLTRLCIYESTSMSVRSVPNKSFDQNKFYELSISVSHQWETEGRLWYEKENCKRKRPR